MISSHFLTKSEILPEDFIFESLSSSKRIHLKDFKGKVILVVNTASKCGFTNQYEGLENLYQKYKRQGLVVLGVPSNDFGGQEPGDALEIQSFCQVNYGVTFPLTAKYTVSGNDSHPFYRWAQKVLGFGTAPKWNFYKYLLDREGYLINYFYSTNHPSSRRFIEAIELALVS